MSDVRYFECVVGFKEGEWMTKGNIYEMIFESQDDVYIIMDDGYKCTGDSAFNGQLDDKDIIGYYLKEITKQEANRIRGVDNQINNQITKVIFKPEHGVTVVFFADGTKQVSKATGADKFDKHVGIAMCCAKKMLGGYGEIDKLVEGFSKEQSNSKAKIRDTDFKIGDRVRVRSWKDMKSEFEIDCEGDIHIPRQMVFSQHMKYLCGEKFTITKLNDFKVYGLDENLLDGWVITTNMIQKVE